MDLQDKIQRAFQEEDWSTYIHYCELLKEARDRVSTNTARKILSKELERKEKMENNQDTYNYVFITYNPPEYVELSDLVKYTQRVALKKWVKGYLYVYEQRGETLMDIHGKHCHMLLHFDDKPKSHICREIANTVKKIVDTSNPSLLNIKFIQKDEMLRKVTYLIGQKADEAKHAKQLNDIQWRLENCLLPYYFSNIEIGEQLRIEDAT